MSFSATGLVPVLLTALAGKGYREPTPVQAQAIPAVLSGRDVLASAPTGSGKTAAFALPLLQLVLSQPPAGPATASRPQARNPSVLVLVPTRELATQVGSTFREVANRLAQPVKVTVVFGGVSINPQMLGLRGGTDVVVATPGRLLDLLEKRALSLQSVRTLVLDEADRLLDQGFAQEWGAIAALLPKARQNLMFSATFSAAVQDMALRILHNPVRIDVPLPPERPADIRQRAIRVDAAKRTQLLRHLLQTEGWARVLVFVASQHAADTVAEKLRKARLAAEPFHAGLTQGKRSQVLADFQASRLQVVVATDVAARGLDISGLPVVVNFDLPRSADVHIHRIGRTGRAGSVGLAISLVSAETEPHLRLIEKRHGLQLVRETVPGFEPALPTVVQPVGAEPRPAEGDGSVPFAAANTTGGLDPNGGIKGRRTSKKDRLRQQQANGTP